MLAESFLAATITPEKPTNNTTLGIHIHDLQPLAALRSTFKKSSSNPNCVAVSRTHIFAAQAEKAVVFVYSRERNNQEATVPFPERIHSIALAGERDGAGILALGTEGGSIILWELGTGRQVSTPQHHLQPITCLAVDPTSNFLISGCSDSSIHLWSLPALLSFSVASWSRQGQDLPFSPLRTLSAHRTAITALSFGHGASRNNIAVSTSKDGTCVIWDISSGTALHTYLLPSDPLCLALDPADRALYVGHDDGSIQLVDFYKQSNATHPFSDPELRNIPTQPSHGDQWPPPPDGGASAVMSLDVSYDGTFLVSGRRDGKVHTWDIATGRLLKQIVDLSAPVSNLTILPPTGFPNESRTNVIIHNVVKPRYESFTNGGVSSEAAIVPSNYSFTAQFTSSISSLDAHASQCSFQDALTHPSFPPSFLEEAVAELSTVCGLSSGPADSTASEDLRKQNIALSSQLEVALAQQKYAENAIKERDQADWKRRQDEEIKAVKKQRRRLSRIRADEVLRKKEMGEPVSRADEETENEQDDLSSSTDEV